VSAPTLTAGPNLLFSGTTGTATFTISNALNCTSGNSAFIGVQPCIDGGTNTITGVTLGGVSMVAVGTQARNVGGKVNSQFFKLVGHSLSGQQTLVISVDGANGYAASAISWEYGAGSDVDQHVETNGTGTTVSATLTSVAANCAILSVMSTQFCANESAAAGSGYTNLDPTNANCIHQGEYLADSGSSGNKVVDYVGCDLDFGLASVSIAAGGGGGAASTPGATWQQQGGMGVRIAI
jgi:hypothetical protein